MSSAGSSSSGINMMRTIQTHLFQYVPVRTVILLAIVVIAMAVSACESSAKPSGGEVAASPAAEGTAPEQAAPTAVPVPPTPVPPPPPPPEPVRLSGRGQFATNPVKPPSTRSVVTFTHSGQRNFIVKSYVEGKESLLVNAIGNYSGQVSIEGDKLVSFDIQADGAWTATIDAIPMVGSGTLQGRGDTVSGLFNPPSVGPWEISHQGQRNFIVYLRCAGGSDLVQNQIGPVSGSRVVTPKRGPCFWEVKADGAFSLRPR